MGVELSSGVIKFHYMVYLLLGIKPVSFVLDVWFEVLNLVIGIYARPIYAVIFGPN